MSIINTTDVIDSSIFLKAKLDKNMVSTNYYIESLQEKRNREWEMRYNRVDIEEELNKQVEYEKNLPVYTPIDVVIRSVKDDRGKDLGTDWADISFKDLKHFNKVGSRYRFSLSFPDMTAMSEEEKYYNTCVWLCVNKSPINAGNSCVIRRCNSSLALTGSPTNSYDNITEVRYEPVVLENDLKYINLYYNQTLVIPQAEWYATIQMNYFTNSIKINDRFLFGSIDNQDLSNNSAYKVKAIVKASQETTFLKENEIGVNNIPLIILALDKDVLFEEDDLEKRIAKQAPIYKTQELDPVYQYFIKVTPNENIIYIGETLTFYPKLFLNDMEIKDVKFSYELNINNYNYNEYCVFQDVYENGENSFSLKCLKENNQQKLNIKINAIIEENLIETVFEITLGGYY